MLTKRIKLNLLFKLSYLNSYFALTLGYLNSALNNPALGPVPERSISANPGLKLCSYVLLRVTFCVIITVSWGKDSTVFFFSSSCMSLDKKTLLKTRLNPGLNLTNFRGTRPSYYSKNCWKRGRGCKTINLSKGFHFSPNDRKNRSFSIFINRFRSQL